jgi:hypothetical protein
MIVLSVDLPQKVFAGKPPDPDFLQARMEEQAVLDSRLLMLWFPLICAPSCDSMALVRSSTALQQEYRLCSSYTIDNH